MAGRPGLGPLRCTWFVGLLEGWGLVRQMRYLRFGRLMAATCHPGLPKFRGQILIRSGRLVGWPRQPVGRLRLLLGRLRWLPRYPMRHQPFGCRGLFFGLMGLVPLLTIAAVPVRGGRRHVALPFCSTPG
jgi:hypothetical protein